ncbi:MAG: 30S ribosomal protein S4e [Methanosarcinales archaeon]|nr:30S ribosomal protein S4e [Methanosarcinales archaeon]
MSRHQKRLSVPKSWNIPRKTNKFVVKSAPGPHSESKSIPLLVALRDMLKLANSSKEVKRILHDGSAMVDGNIVRDYRFPVGLFDVITIPKINTSYRVLLDRKQRIMLHEVTDSGIKLYRIKNKTNVKGGATQLNLHDGSNIISDEFSYRTSDSVLVSIPERKVLQHLMYKPGNLALITGGAHSGELATIKEIKKVRSSMPNMVSLQSTYDFETVEDYVFVIGKNTSEMELPDEKGDVID